MTVVAEMPGLVPERLSSVPVLTAAGVAVEPGDALPFDAPAIPTALSSRELDYLHWLASTMTGAGRVVELGSFLGGSTAALVHGLQRSSASDERVLAYDMFRVPALSGGSPAAFDAWLERFGLARGASFLDRFERLHWSWLHRISVRPVEFPESVSSWDDGSLYPEREPIELLFVDVAKSWALHQTVLGVFAAHLLPGGTMVQQDFMDAQTPWIPLHMYQLRDVFEPLDVVRGTPSVSFRCVGEPSAVRGAVRSLWPASAFDASSERARVWSDVIDYWGGLIGRPAAGVLHGHAAVHAMRVGDASLCLEHATAYERWARSGASASCYVTESWSTMLAEASEMLPSLAMVAGASLARDELRRPFGIGAGVGGAARFCPVEVRAMIWRRTFEQLRDAGHRRVALFGGGRHTRWLVEAMLPQDGIEVVCVLDDAPAVSALGGLPVVNASTPGALPAGVTAVLPSSDAHEAQIRERAFELFGASGVAIWRVYASGEARDDAEALLERGAPAGVPALAASAVACEREAAHRARLSLGTGRPWLEAFCSAYRVPAWARGYVTARDALFLWDLVDAVRPELIVEVGTASGVSSAMLIAAQDALVGPSASLVTCDARALCYFDESRSVGSAIGEMAPGLAERVRVTPYSNASDVSRMLAPGSVALAFVDADHRHPAPVLDVLALLEVLAPGAWVVLHDIELSALTAARPDADWEVATGAERLFRAWPFERVSPDGADAADRNIGAIRMPARVSDALPVLLGLLGGSGGAWEVGEAGSKVRSLVERAAGLADETA